MNSTILLGPAGSGKGTLARGLAERHPVAVFETGARLREVATEVTPMGDLLRRRLSGGNMADTPLVMRILDETLAHPPAGAAHWLLDGIPRTPDQAEHFLARVAAGTLPVSSVLVLEAPRDLLQKRLLERSTCSRCGAIYNDQTQAPPSAERCTPACGGQLTRRDDDTPAGIARRFDLFDAETLPAIQMLEAAGLSICRLDATRTRAEVLRVADRNLTRSAPSITGRTGLGRR